MAFITNQWLTNVIRGRSYFPIKVKLEMEIRSEDSDWAKANSVVVSLRLVREDLDYQKVYFTQQDLLYFLPTFFRISHESIQYLIARFVIEKLSDKALLEILKERLEADLKKSE